MHLKYQQEPKQPQRTKGASSVKLEKAIANRAIEPRESFWKERHKQSSRFSPVLD
jgi:hypothetical protein